VVIPWVNDAIAVAKGTMAAPVSPVASKLDVIHKYLGLTVKSLTPDDAEARGLQTNGGLLITHVDSDSPASDAGLKPNMIIVMIGNRQITDEKSLPKELLQVQTGTNIRLQVLIIQSMGPLTIQRGGSVMLTAR
jgi:S1-C subfamily serine protease